MKLQKKWQNTYVPNVYILNKKALLIQHWFFKRSNPAMNNRGADLQDTEMSVLNVIDTELSLNDSLLFASAVDDNYSSIKKRNENIDQVKTGTTFADSNRSPMKTSPPSTFE